MSWEDRDYSENPYEKFGKPGGDWQGLKPSWDNPLTWSLLLGRVFRIAVRIHLFFIIFIAFKLIRAAFPAKDAGMQYGVGVTAVQLGCLFGIVLLHEFGHSLTCRRVGGESNEILMWPLGGLAFCRPPQRWQAHFLTAAGGPMVNVVICLIVGGILWAKTGVFWGIAAPHLFEAMPHEVAASGLLRTLYFLNFFSLLLLLFNLLPIFPLDGGRLLQSLLWPKLGYSKSMRFAVRTGYVGALALAVVGLVMDEYMLLAIAVFGCITCYVTHKQVEFTDQFMGYGDNEYGLFDEPGKEDPQEVARQQKEEKQEQDEAEKAKELDRILAKISTDGKGSLTRSEERFLKQVTKQQQKQQ